MNRRLLAPAVLLACCALAGSAFGHSFTPFRRAHHSLVYDAAQKVVLLCFGSTPRGPEKSIHFYNDLWAYDACGWQPVGVGGDTLSGVGVAYDSRRGRVVAFGGFDGRSRGELRTLDGTRWKDLAAPMDPGLAEPGFVYDAARDRFVAFGGSPEPGRASGDTWEFDGRSWTRIAIPGPPARRAHAMAYDVRRRRTLVFGGSPAAPPGQPPAALGDTWEYDGKRWIERRVAGPPPRSGAGVTYDARRGLVIVFGGMGSDGFLGDTWGWNGEKWRKLADTGPAPRGTGMLAYDSQRDRVVLFGGRDGRPDGDLNDTWEWDGERWSPARPLDCW